MAYTETARKRSRTAAGIFPAISAGTITFTPPAINAGVTNADTFNIPGARVGDLVFVSPKVLAGGLIVVGAEIQVGNSLFLKIMNPTAGSVSGSSSQISYIVLRG